MKIFFVLLWKEENNTYFCSGMMEIEAKKDNDQSSEGKNLVRCPSCRQVLADIRMLKGYGTVRVKCRRCGTYTNIDIVGT